MVEKGQGPSFNAINFFAAFRSSSWSIVTKLLPKPAHIETESGGNEKSKREREGLGLLFSQANRYRPDRPLQNGRKQHKTPKITNMNPACIGKTDLRRED